MNHIQTILLSGILVLVGCSSQPQPLSKQLTSVQKQQLDTVYQFTVKPTQVTFVVKSHGCTLPEHFELKQNLNSKGEYEFALLRKKQDRCKAMPRAFPVHFELTKKVTEKSLVTLLNPQDNQQNLPRKGTVRPTRER